jgi:hypothetical protein
LQLHGLWPGRYRARWRWKSSKAEGKAVYDYITKTNPYQNWALFPGKDKLYKGAHPHDAPLTSYVNDIALKGINDKVGTLANGAIIIKENYMPNKMLGVVTVMCRVGL